MEEWNKEKQLEEIKKSVFDLLKKTVRPEFLNRIDETILFQPLNSKDIRKVVEIQFKLIQKRLEENGMRIEASNEVLDFLGEAGFDPQFGARPLKRVMQRMILNELSKQILAGTVQKDSLIALSLSNKKEIEFINLDAVKIQE